MDDHVPAEGVFAADAGYTLSHRVVVPYRLGLADPPYKQVRACNGNDGQVLVDITCLLVGFQLSSVRQCHTDRWL